MTLSLRIYAKSRTAGVLITRAGLHLKAEVGERRRRRFELPEELSTMPGRGFFDRRPRSRQLAATAATV